MEFEILYAINNLHNPILDKIMIGITSLGNGGLIWIAIAVFLLFIKKTRKCRNINVSINADGLNNRKWNTKKPNSKR